MSGRNGASSLGREEVAKKKVQVLVHDDERSNADLWSLLEGQGFSVVAAAERKSPRLKRNPRRKVSPAAEGDHHAGSVATPEDLYEGTVKLVVVSDQRVRKMVGFIDQLRQNSGFRLLMVESTQHSNAVSIMLGLREPTALRDALMAMEDVTNVEALADTASESSEPVLQVTLE
jgi:hypothetical protein